MVAMDIFMSRCYALCILLHYVCFDCISWRDPNNQYPAIKTSGRGTSGSCTSQCLQAIWVR